MKTGYEISDYSNLNHSAMHYHHLQSPLNNQNHSPIRTTGSERIVHVTIQPSPTTQSIINSNSLQRNNDLFSIDIKDYRNQSKKLSELRKNSINSVNVTRVHRPVILQSQPTKTTWASNSHDRLLRHTSNGHHGMVSKVRKSRLRSSKVVHHEHIKSDDFDTAIDHHQSLKKNRFKLSSKACLIALIISLIVLIIASIVTILLIIFIKPKTTSTTTSTKTALLRWNTTGITIAGVTNTSGNTSNQLYEPWDLALDWSNALYVTDQKNNRVQKFLRDSLIGTTVAGQANTTGGLTLNYLRGPLGIIVDDNRNLYISDNSNDRIVFWPDGASSGSLFAGNGIAGSSLGQLSDPYGLAHDPNSNTIYIADFANHRIMRYSQNNHSSGALVAGGNGNGTNYTQLLLPNSIYYDSLSNSLLIVNTGAHNIVRWVLGDSNWTLAVGTTNGTRGTSSEHLKSPTDVTLDPMGNMYVADRNNHRIQFYSAGESNGTTIVGMTGISGSNSTLLNYPSSIILDNQLNLYVVDRMNHRIQKFLRY